MCVKIAHHLNYTIEEVLRHNINWVNKMIQVIAKDEFEKNIFQLSLHGVPKEELDDMRNRFDTQIDDKPTTIADSRIERMKLEGFGFRFGKKSKTKVINRS